MIKDVIKEILIEKLFIEEEAIHDEAFMQKDLELDSTESVVIALEIKKRYRVDYHFPDQDITLKDMAAAVESLLALEGAHE